MHIKDDPYIRVRLTPTGPEVTGKPSGRVGQDGLPDLLRSDQDPFVEWHWDGQRIVVRNCRLGFFPAFYYATDREFGVASSLQKLIELGAPQELDDVAMSVFIRLGWMLGEDTPFRAIRMLPPGGEAIWSGGPPNVSGGYMFPAPLSITRQAAVERHGELIRQAVRRRASPEVRFGFPLSGGHDSRHLILELNAIGCKPDICITNHDFPPYREQNIEVAQIIAKRLGLAHRRAGQPGSRLKTEIHKNQLNQFGSMENIWCVSLYPLIAQFTPLVYEGSPGNNYFGEYVQEESVRLYEEGRLGQLADKILEKWLTWQSSEEALARILTPAAIKRFSYDLARQRLEEELGKYRGTANPISSFYFWTRGRRVAQMQPLSIARQSGVSTVTPYLDHDLVDFLASVPADIVMNKKFFNESTSRMHPEFDDIPYAGDHPTPLIEDNLHYRRFLLEAAAYLATAGNGQLVRRTSTLKHLSALAFSGGNLRMRMKWMAPYTAIYLTQLEAMMSRIRLAD
jgi:hypothetical protein